MIVLIVVPVLLTALVLALVFTPLGHWAGMGATALVRGFMGLPGIAWAREQSGTTVGASRQGPTSATVNAIQEVLKAGYLLQEEQSYGKALDRYQDALALDEDYAPTHMALAALYLQLDRQEEALQEMEHVNELAPGDSFVLSQLGQLYLKQNEFDEAVDALEEAREVDPENAVVGYWLGVAYHYRSYADIEMAVLELQRAIELEPEEAEAHYHLAMTLLRRDDPGDDEQAIDALLETLKLDPAQSEAYYYLGRAYLEIGQPEAAVKSWKQYIVESDDEVTVARVREWLSNVPDELEIGDAPGPGTQ